MVNEVITMNEGIAITLQNFVQVTLYHQCGQYCNTFI
jgi:hypothetical protein